MTAQQHNKILGITHLAYSGLSLLLGIGSVFIVALMMSSAAHDRGAPPPVFFVVIGVFLFLFYAALAVPSLVAGLGLLKRKRWAKIWTIIAAVLASMQFPFGTALTVYSFWFLFSEPGKAIYDTPTQLLPGAPATFDNAAAERERAYAYRTPPDWR